jgi:hypothetical protein
VNESTTIEIRFNSAAVDVISSDELALIESIAPDLLRELMQSVDLAEIG